MFKGNIIRGHSFFTAMDRLKTFRINRFIKVPPRTGMSLLEAVTPGIDRPPRRDESVPVSRDDYVQAQAVDKDDTGDNEGPSGTQQAQTQTVATPHDTPTSPSLVSDYADLFPLETQDKETANEQQAHDVRGVSELVDHFLDDAARTEGKLIEAGEKMATDAANLANMSPLTKTAQIALNEGEELLSAAVNKLRGME